MELNIRKCLLPVMIEGGWLVAVDALAQLIPPLINYQGRLANPDGSPFPTADYSLTVRLYNAPAGGRMIWGPQLFDGAAGPGRGLRIPVVQGYFNLMLGPTDTNEMSLADAFTNAACFVEVTVTNRPPIRPRQQILSAPFALMAGMVTDGAVTTDKLAVRAVSAEKIALGAINQTHLDRIALPLPDYDSEWFDITIHQTYVKSIGFQGLPALVMAYYKLPGGEVFAWGLNQYGDSNQGNGVALDFDEAGKLYVRAPSGNSVNNTVMHLGGYRNRTNTGSST